MWEYPNDWEMYYHMNSNPYMLQTPVLPGAPGGVIPIPGFPGSIQIPGYPGNIQMPGFPGNIQMPGFPGGPQWEEFGKCVKECQSKLFPQQPPQPPAQKPS
jgi:hypothetical protein